MVYKCIERANTSFPRHFFGLGGRGGSREKRKKNKADGEESSYVYSYVQVKSNITNPREKTCGIVLPDFLTTGYYNS